MPHHAVDDLGVLASREDGSRERVAQRVKAEFVELRPSTEVVAGSRVSRTGCEGSGLLSLDIALAFVLPDRLAPA